MPKPDELISACIFTCEMVLRDKDDVFSAIRIADIYNAPENIPPDIPPEQVGVPIKAVFLAKFSATDGSQYTIRFRQIRPDGSEQLLSEKVVKLKAKTPLPDYIPRGVNIELKMIVQAIEGVHYLAADIEGNEIARCPFTIMRTQAANPESRE